MCTPADVAAPEEISALDALDRAHSLGALSDDLRKQVAVCFRVR